MKQLAVVAMLLVTSDAYAQTIEVPVLVMDASGTDQNPEVDAELNLANLVQTAAKGLTTVQEAPAIVTIIPADEIKDRNARQLTEVIDRIPGWIRSQAEYSQFPSVSPRGAIQAVLLLRDGVSMFDSMVNIATVSRMQPLETVKRLEVVTGPGGVLWGANSFLGVINVITKDAEDVKGVEASVGAGTGPGDKDVLRGYVMAGLPKLFGGKAKLFIHTSFETYIGPIYHLANHLLSSPTPSPNGPPLFGADVDAEPARSMMFNIDGKLSVGPITLYWMFPVGQRFFGVGFPGNVVRQNVTEDDLARCSQIDPSDPRNLDPTDPCTDRGHVYREDLVNFFERYGVLEWRNRFSNKAGIDAKVYFIQFVRDFAPLAVESPIPGLLKGGLSFNADFTSYRAGGTVDGDVELPGNMRVVYGAEAFHEWLPDNTTASRQGAGTETRFTGPYNLAALPLPCPRTATWGGTDVTNVQFVPQCPLTFAFESDRTVLGAYASLQWRPTEKLILDAGVRAQAAPTALGKRGYDPVPLVSGAVVYEFIPDWHVKLNFTQGFRPPVFNNTDSNAKGVQIAGNPNLEVEKSAAFQTEVNARLLKGVRHIRELDFRADYSYTRLDNFIAPLNGFYTNTGARGIHSAEVLAKLYLKGDHRLELGYTWLRTDTDDKGLYRADPQHWFNIGAVISLIPRKLELNGTVRVYGAFEDPDMRVETRNLMYDPTTGWARIDTPGQVVKVLPTDEVLDRIPPAAELEAGIRWRMLKDHLILTAQVYNALNVRHFTPDAFMDFEPRNERVPTPYEDISFFCTATYAY